MPQLDIMSFTTQIFWALVAVIAVYAIIVRFILPDVLLIFRIRAKLLNRFQRNLFTFKQTSSISSNKFSVVSKQLEENFGKTVSLEATESQIASLILSQVKPTRLDLLSFVHSLDSMTEQEKVAPFLVFLAPTDEFILTISFLLFFLVFYYLAAPTIVNLLFVNQTKELTNNFARFAELRRQNLQQSVINYQTKQFLAIKGFTALNTYNALYTSLVLALTNQYKDTRFNELLSSLTATQGVSDFSKARLQRLCLSEESFSDDNFYSKIRLFLFLSKHINILEEELDVLEEVFNLEELALDLDESDFDEEEK